MATLIKTRTPSQANTSLRGYLTVLASTVIMSTTGLFIKTLLNNFGMEALALAFLRVSIVSLTLGVPLLIWRRSWFKVHLRDLPLFALYGLLGVGIHQFMWITSVQLNGAGVATVLVYVQPAIVVLISWRVLHEPLTRQRLTALALSLSGMVLVSRAYDLGNSNLTWLGLLVGFGSGLTWASYALLGRLVTRRYNPWTAVWYAFFFGALFLLPVQFLVRDTFSLGTNWTGWALLSILSIGPTLGGFALYTIGLAHIPASVVTLIGAFEPVLSVTLAYLLFNEVLDPIQILGAGLILWSVLMLRPR